ncbi:hypothetical protein HW555_002926 [Spodoptera exigua]|uniref:E3 ubiquitin-protein ligase Sina-like RING finger domain-containing protein n=1 Tax=Spodoptera exigua TaxID=7107 RepID=A0A835GM68_SPOEX|nr:hypothetical protein HW555_002926 [Spodoptera exigua]
MKNFEKNRHVLPSYKAAKKTNKRTPVPLPECLCMDPLYAPIYQCESGHNMCAKCTKESPVCPICRKSTGAMRNWQLEEIITYYRDKMKDFDTS